MAADRPYYSGKHRKRGMNVQVIPDPFGRLLCASSPALPGAGHDIRAARTRGILGALARADIRARPTGDTGVQAAASAFPSADVGEACQPDSRPTTAPAWTSAREEKRPEPPSRPVDSCEAAMQHHPHHRPGQNRPHPLPHTGNMGLGEAHGRMIGCTERGETAGAEDATLTPRANGSNSVSQLVICCSSRCRVSSRSSRRMINGVIGSSSVSGSSGCGGTGMARGEEMERQRRPVRRDRAAPAEGRAPHGPPRLHTSERSAELQEILFLPHTAIAWEYLPQEWGSGSGIAC